MLPMVRSLLDDIPRGASTRLCLTIACSRGNLTDAMGKTVPVLSALDMLGMLVRKGSDDRSFSAWSLPSPSRQCYFCIPIDPDEVSATTWDALPRRMEGGETAPTSSISVVSCSPERDGRLCTATDLLRTRSGEPQWSSAYCGWIQPHQSIVWQNPTGLSPTFFRTLGFVPCGFTRGEEQLG